jgi:MinD-like ATPase involved in chromosome partitioning or flagellar assembly
MKIIPIASGKGGVGKTTLALNLALALSRQYKTVLIDLDAGTSSLRNFLQMKIGKDIYHFLKKDHPLDKCLVELDQSLDPENLFSGFRMIASPRNFISDIVNMDNKLKTKLIRGINHLQADYVILDLKAGIDEHVLDFLPITNTGILVFTPRMQAAAMTAAEMVRAILLRICRILLEPESLKLDPGEILKTEDFRVLASIVDRLEDSYNRRMRNFDLFFQQAEERYPETRIIPRLKGLINHFRVNFVLNQFDGLEASAEQIIGPFVRQLHRMISASMSPTNLGWVIYSEEIRDSSEYALPYLIMQQYRRKPKVSDRKRIEAELEELMGVKRADPVERPRSTPEDIENNEVTRQLDVLKKMVTRGSGQDPAANFDFVMARLQALGKSSIHHCGMNRILTPDEIRNIFYT